MAWAVKSIARESKTTAKLFEDSGSKRRPFLVDHWVKSITFQDVSRCVVRGVEVCLRPTETQDALLMML